MVQAKGAHYTKSSLEKALKARLAALTQSLSEADVGGKGIDLVKEIKELHLMIASLQPESKSKKIEGAKLVVQWGSQLTAKQEHNEDVASQNMIADDKINE